AKTTLATRWRKLERNIRPITLHQGDAAEDKALTEGSHPCSSVSDLGAGIAAGGPADEMLGGLIRQEMEFDSGQAVGVGPGNFTLAANRAAEWEFKSKLNLRPGSVVIE